MFKRSQIWNRAATLLPVVAPEWRQLAESTRHPMFLGRDSTDPPACRGNAAGWGRMGTSARAEQLCIPEGTVPMPGVLGSLLV